MEIKLEKKVLVYFINSLVAVIFFNISKPFADYFFGISPPFVTIFQIIVIVIYFSTFFKYLSFNLIMQLALTYFSLLALINFAYREVSLVQSITGLFNVYTIIFTFALFKSNDGKLIFNRFNNLVLFFLTYSLLISLNQHFEIAFAFLFNNYGGNIVSGNQLGMFRANGGVGGTVIEYAFLLSIACIYTAHTWKYNDKKLYFIFVIGLSFFLSFSRSTGVSLFLLLMYLFFFKANVNLLFRILVLAVMIVSLILYYPSIEQVLIFNEEVSGTSDLKRITQWDILENFSDMSLFFGAEFGENIGYSGLDGTKSVSDGYILAIIADAGFTGLFLIMSFILLAYRNNQFSIIDYFFTVLLIFILLFINSGMSKTFNVILCSAMLFYPLSLKFNNRNGVF